MENASKNDCSLSLELIYQVVLEPQKTIDQVKFSVLESTMIEGGHQYMYIIIHKS